MYKRSKVKREKEIDTHDLRINFGVHNGERVTRLPIKYLKYIINNFKENEYWRRVAEAELERRGTTTPDLEISGHAIDRASLALRWKWHDSALNEQEGLNSWLIRYSGLALASDVTGQAEKIEYDGLKFVFERSTTWPVLKTIMEIKNSKK